MCGILTHGTFRRPVAVPAGSHNPTQIRVQRRPVKERGGLLANVSFDLHRVLQVRTRFGEWDVHRSIRQGRRLDVEDTEALHGRQPPR